MRKLWSKISFRLIILTAIVFIPVLIVLVAYNIQNTHAATNTLIRDNQSQLDAAVSQLDNILDVTEAMLQSMANSTEMIDTIRYYDAQTADEGNRKKIEYQQAVNLLSQRLSNMLSGSDFLENVFIYFPGQSLFYNSNKNLMLTEYIYERLRLEEQKTYNKNWMPVYVDEHWYILRIWRYYDNLPQNSFMVGSWFSLEKLLGLFQISVSDKDLVFFSDYKGSLYNDSEVYINTENLVSGDIYMTKDSAASLIAPGTKYYYIYAASDKAPVRLVKLLNEKTVKELSPDISKAIFAMFFSFVVLIMLFIVCIRRWLLRPMATTMEAMDIVRGGHMERRVSVNPADCVEFTSLATLFNDMMDQVNQLKNEVYEGQLERQEIRLEYLQQQIQPHFILNTLNTLYNHTEDEVQKEIILLMTRYFRFVVNVDSKYVQLGQELEHIGNYLKLQSIRYPQAFTYDIRCEDALEIIPVPPFLIESFVGNSIKHALNFVDCVHICIDVSLVDKFTTRIRISDDGEGFDEEILDLIDDYLEHKTVHEELGVGIRNSIERLKLIYGEKASIHIYNGDHGGATVDIDLLLQEG